MADLARSASALVVDASVAVKWHLLDEEHATEAALVLTDFGQGVCELIAPTQIRYEVPSAFTVATQHRTPRLTQDQARAAIEEFLALGIQTVDDDRLILDAHGLAQEHACAFYDGLYVALSQQTRLPFVTADNRLYRRIQQLPRIIWIADYPRDAVRAGADT